MRKLEWVSAVFSVMVLSACNDGGGSNLTGVQSCRVSARAVVPKLRGHIPRVVKSFADQGKTPENTQLTVTIAMELNHEMELANEISELYRPGSPKYHQFLSPEDFRARYAPTDQQLEQVQSFLKSKGITVAGVNENRLFVRARADLATLNSVFSTEVHQYQDAQGNSFYAPASEPKIPDGLSIQAVHGLQNVTRLKRPPLQLVTSKGGTGPAGGFSPQDLRSAYNIPSSLNGAGQTLAVFELDGYTPSDVSAYESYFGLPQMALQNVLVDGASGSAGGVAAEVLLDVELMVAIAPGASKIIVYEGPNSDQGILDTYARIANDNLAKAISTSWGSAETGSSASVMQTENNIFAQMAAQGQSIYSAAGDSGARDNGSTLSVDDPSAQPYMVGVGGTTLSTGSSGAFQGETTWSLGGGGISSVWPIPSWQSGVVSSASKGSTTKRNVPDVALNADPNTGYSIYQSGWSTWGGTSAAAPMWAAFTALVNQQRAANGLGPLGFPNPALYQIGQSARYSADFHDIADGSTNGYYPAVAGYDDATGLGTFNAQNLIQDLSGGSPPGALGACP